MASQRRGADAGHDGGPHPGDDLEPQLGETQATDLLGFTDATVLTTTFGVFLADEVQKIQVVFLAGCRDETSTAFAAQRFRDWLAQSHEDAALVERARSRRRIVKAIHDEQRTLGHGARWTGRAQSQVPEPGLQARVLSGNAFRLDPNGRLCVRPMYWYAVAGTSMTGLHETSAIDPGCR